VLLTASLRN